MANIQFEEPQYARPMSSVNRRSWLTTLVIKTGLARDAAGVQRVLLAVLVLAIAGILAVLAFGGRSATGPQVPQSQIDAAMQTPYSPARYDR